MPESRAIKSPTLMAGLLSQSLRTLWRGGLPPFGGEAVAKAVNAMYLIGPYGWLWGRFAAQRGQAPSPQVNLIMNEGLTFYCAAMLYPSNAVCCCRAVMMFLRLTACSAPLLSRNVSLSSSLLRLRPRR